VCDGAGKASDSGELLRLHEGKFGAFVFGDVDTEDDDSGDGSIGLADGLIDEVEEALFKRSRECGPGELDGSAVADEGLAGFIDRVEEREKALLFGLRNGFADGFADEASLSDELLIEGVDHFEDVVGAAKDGEEGWSLLEETVEPFLACAEVLLGEEASGCVGADDKGAADDSGGVADGTVAVGPVDVFEFSVAEDGDELVFVPGGFAGGHDGVDLRTDDRPDLRPAVDAALAEGAGMLVGSDAGAVGVVVELDEVFAPPEEHGIAGGEEGVDSDQQDVGPLFDGANGSLAPIKGTGTICHLAGAVDETLAGCRGRGNGDACGVLAEFYSHELLLQHKGLMAFDDWLSSNLWVMRCIWGGEGWLDAEVSDERDIPTGLGAGGVKGVRVAYAFWMRIRVLYFGVLKDVMGQTSAAMDVAEGTSVKELVELHRRVDAGAVWDSIAVAVNQEYARPGDGLKDGDEVALLPPVSGGVEGLERYAG
jgi:molybdopterin converting factor subunit 1